MQVVEASIVSSILAGFPPKDAAVDVGVCADSGSCTAAAAAADDEGTDAAAGSGDVDERSCRGTERDTVVGNSGAETVVVLLVSGTTRPVDAIRRRSVTFNASTTAMATRNDPQESPATVNKSIFMEGNVARIAGAPNTRSLELIVLPSTKYNDEDGS